MHGSLCLASGSCQCAYGLYGQFCQNLWTTGNEEAFAAFRWTFFALFAVLLILCVLATIEFWARKVVKFPYISQEQGGLLFAALAAVCALLYLGIDPYRLEAARANVLTTGYRIGIGILANVTLSSICNGWVMIMLIWFRIRSPFLRVSSRQKIWLRVLWSLVIATFAVAILFGALLPLIGTTVSRGLLFRTRFFLFFFSCFKADIVFYIYLGAVAVVIGVVTLVSATLTYRQLSVFSNRHKDRLVRLSLHMVAYGVAIIMAIIILVVVAVAPLNSSFLGFYLGRCWVAFSVQFMCNSLIPLLLKFRKWKSTSFSLWYLWVFVSLHPRLLDR
jgi:hypothetical protein